MNARISDLVTLVNEAEDMVIDEELQKRYDELLLEWEKTSEALDELSTRMSTVEETVNELKQAHDGCPSETGKHIIVQQYNTV